MADVVVEFRRRKHRPLPQYTVHEYTDTRTRVFAWTAAICIVASAVAMMCIVVPIPPGVKKQWEIERILKSPKHEKE